MQKMISAGVKRLHVILILLGVAVSSITSCANTQTSHNQGLTSLSLNNVAVSVSDIDRSVEWYKRVLGFKLASRTTFPPVSAEVAFLSRPGFSLELLQVPNNIKISEVYASPPAHLRPLGYKAIVFDVDNLKAASEELKTMDVTIVWSQQVIDPSTGLTSTLIRDPDGNLINIFQRR
jgi:catechol 2,3-dioxygenase-like lactoylglutathione lyase family enzyme